eukprot:TRINITY_DN22053_c0_g1_i1.p1 TRINITY_DN22053_c0_g1~~TRINITY_DN22053_c0_g1_i1.p1  ORF type:complete len:574 (-),score=55.50 TRINITY_DN22053_c0_g1_i1:233-1924(-)
MTASPSQQAVDNPGPLLTVCALDPHGELSTPHVKVHVGVGQQGALCCPVCRRPFSMEFGSSLAVAREQGDADTSSGRYRVCIRNANDLRSRWVPASYVDVVFPEQEDRCVVECVCPHCKKSIELAVSRNMDEGWHDLGQHGSENANQDFAYATLLYGSAADYFIGALVLGATLAKPVLEPEKGPSYRRVLLHTDDVPSEYLQALSHYWELRLVVYLTGAKAMYYDYESSRFKEVFTKLQALNQVEFGKLLMLDNDLIIRRNIDELFDLEAPAALKRPGGRDQPAHGKRYGASIFWAWRQLQADEQAHDSDMNGWKYDMMSGINAGVMLLKPDRIVYERMCAEIRDHEHPEHLDCYGPEQEYIGRFYSAFGPGWTHMDSRFNYQPLLGRGANHFMRSLDAYQDVAITHFSGPRIKPWAGLVDRHQRLEPESLRRLLHEDDESFALRFPENPRLPATGAEKYGEKGYPTLVVSLIQEWTKEFRCVARALLEHQSLDLVGLVGKVEQRERMKKACFVRRLVVYFVCSRKRTKMFISALTLALLRFAFSRRASWRSLWRDGKRLALK